MSYDDIFDVEQRPSAGVKYWGRAVQIQLDRLADSNRESLVVISRSLRDPEQSTDEKDESVKDRFHLDVHFLLIAIRNVVRFHEAIANVVQDNRLALARAEFKSLVPDAVSFRDFYEHLDEYVLGRGKDRLVGRTAPVLHRKVGDERVTISFGEATLEVVGAAQAAVSLAEATSVVWEGALDAAKPTSRPLPPTDDGVERHLKVHMSVSEVVEDEHGAFHSVGVLRAVEITE